MSRKQMWKCKQVKTACPFRNVLCVCLCCCVSVCVRACVRACVCEAVILRCVKTTCRSVSAVTLDPCPPCVCTRQLGVCVGTWPSTSLAALTWTRSAPAVSVGGVSPCSQCGWAVFMFVYFSSLSVHFLFIYSSPSMEGGLDCGQTQPGPSPPLSQPLPPPPCMHACLQPLSAVEVCEVFGMTLVTSIIIALSGDLYIVFPSVHNTCMLLAEYGDEPFMV